LDLHEPELLHDPELFILTEKNLDPTSIKTTKDEGYQDCNETQETEMSPDADG